MNDSCLPRMGKKELEMPGEIQWLYGICPVSEMGQCPIKAILGQVKLCVVNAISITDDNEEEDGNEKMYRDIFKKEIKQYPTKPSSKSGD